MSATKSLIVSPIYTRILSHFPQTFTFCFAYGSGVKKQLVNPKDKIQSKMIDLIYCVDNPQNWHEVNLKIHSTHYSSLKHLGYKFIAKFQENAGARVYYNTLIPVEDMLIKYGIISTKDLITDLLDWSDLYLAGRLHKPVEILRQPSNHELEVALHLNLQSAVHAALLILPEKFNEYEFYYTISNLSYAGDFRMIFGENKNKVENIVIPQIHSFRKLYKPFIKHLCDYVDIPMVKDYPDDAKLCPTWCIQDSHPTTKLHHLNQLPRWPQKALTRYWNRGSFKQDTEDVLRAVAYDPDCSNIVAHCIDNIVWKSSVKQSLKGILTAGLLRSLKYSTQKIKKMLL